MNEDPTEKTSVSVELTYEDLQYLAVLVAHDIRLDAAFSSEVANRHRPVLSKLQRALAPYQESSL
jgi:hypothetical protein